MWFNWHRGSWTRLNFGVHKMRGNVETTATPTVFWSTVLPAVILYRQHSPFQSLFLNTPSAYSSSACSSERRCPAQPAGCPRPPQQLQHLATVAVRPSMQSDWRSYHLQHDRACSTAHFCQLLGTFMNCVNEEYKKMQTFLWFVLRILDERRYFRQLRAWVYGVICYVLFQMFSAAIAKRLVWLFSRKIYSRVSAELTIREKK